MTTVYIDSDDRNKIQEFLDLAMQKFHFKVKVAPLENREYRSISNDLDKQIRSAKSTNTAKAQKLKDAMEGLHDLLDPSKINLSVGEAREEYFNAKNR